jgi:hypothetical protein
MPSDWALLGLALLGYLLLRVLQPSLPQKAHGFSMWLLTFWALFVVTRLTGTALQR